MTRHDRGAPPNLPEFHQFASSTEGVPTTTAARDLALFKRDAGERGGIAAWPERLHWVTSRKHPIDFRRDPLPLVMSEQGSRAASIASA